MKISYKNTALGVLENPMTFQFYLPNYTVKMTPFEEEEFKYSIRKAVQTAGFQDAWRNNVQYVTLPFHEAYMKARPKVKAVVQETAFEEAGTIIIPWKGHTQTIFYGLASNGDKDNWKYEVLMMIFTKSPKSEEFGLDLFVYVANDGKDFRERIWEGFEEGGRDSSWFIADLMCFKTFLKYADVESKVVNGHRREKHLGNKYINEMKYNVEVLDSTYFTTISRTEGFGVSGHFRMQPYGPGMQSKRLQWISDYQKSGYTRKAKILNK